MVKGAYEEYCNKLESICQKYEKKVAITYMREEGRISKITYGQILEGGRKIHDFLKQANIHKGDRVAVLAPHSPQVVLAGIALAYCNVTTVLIDSAIPVTEINRLIKFSDVRGLFTTEKLFKNIDEDIVTEIPAFALLDKENEYALFQQSAAQAKKAVTTDPEFDVIAILFSSGTTAQMKGIKITYKSVLLASKIFIRNIAWKDSYKYLHVFPFNHIAGYATAHAFLSCGSELGMIENMSAVKLQKALLSYEPHGFGMIPKVFETMEDKVRENIRQRGKMIEKLILTLLSISGYLRKHFGIVIGRKLFKSITKQIFGKNITTIGTGASLCRESTSKFFLDLGLYWANFYALTETNVPAAATGIYDRYPVLMAGNVIRNPEIEIKIDNQENGGTGEILVKSDLVMKGYFREEELTHKSFENGYLKTGDCGYIDENNNLYVIGRVKESILLHNGKKISPIDVENYYKPLASNVEIACCGILQNEKSYDEVHLFLQTGGVPQEIITETEYRISRASQNGNSLYKIDYLHRIDKIPLTTVGKVKRFELQSYVNDKKANLEELSSIGEKNTIENKVKEIVREIIGNSIPITSDKRIQEDLGLDSLNIYELEAQIEVHFGIRVGNAWTEINTLEDLVIYIETQINIKKQSSSILKTEIYPQRRSKADMIRLIFLIYISGMICKIEFKGLENLQDGTAYIIAPNHSSHLDVICVYKALYKKYGIQYLYKMCCMAAKELQTGRYMKKVFRSIGAIPVDRDGDTITPLKMARRAITGLGCSVLIFPEGTRTRNGTLCDFQKGAAGIAANTKTPIVPIGIMGAYEIWSPWDKVPKLFHKRKKVVVHIGKPICPKDMDAVELTGILKQEVHKLCEGK